jgi:hypothetical protein
MPGLCGDRCAPGAVVAIGAAPGYRRNATEQSLSILDSRPMTEQRLKLQWQPSARCTHLDQFIPDSAWMFWEELSGTERRSFSSSVPAAAINKLCGSGNLGR